MRLRMRLCQQRLALAWLLGSGTMMILLIVQSTRGVYGQNVEKAWSWFLPTTLPTLSLIIGSLIHHSGRLNSNATADKLVYQVAYWMSIGYLLVVLSTFLLQPFSASTPLQLMTMSQFWLAPLQGLVSLALGAFFVSRKAT
jgi:hypothetical protein